MAYDTLKAYIREYIKTNHENEISGQIMQDVLIAMVDEYPSLTGYATQEWVGQQGFLTSASLTGYATQQWVQEQGYLTASDLSSYATQQWVGNQLAGYLPLDAGNSHPLTGDLYVNDKKVRFSSGTSGNVLSAYVSSSKFSIGKSLANTEETNVSIEHNKITLSDEFNDFDEGWITNTLIITPTGISVNNQPFATQAWVQGQGYATQSWVGQNFLSLSNGGTIGDNDYELGITEKGLTFKYNGTTYGTISLTYGADGAEFDISSNAKLGGDAIATQNWVEAQGYLGSSTIIINAITKSDDGNLKFSGRNFADTYIDFTHSHRFEELTDLPTLLQDFGITGGTLSDLAVALLTVGTTLTISDGNDYISIDGNGITVYDETAGSYTIGVSANGDMLVGAGVVASSFVKSGGTSSQFLKADGSIDSNTYLTSSALSGYATQTWVRQQGYLTSSDLSGYATETWVGQQGFLTSASLNGYATQTWVGQQGYLTSASLNGYATQTWVGQNYLSLNNGGTVNDTIIVSNGNDYVSVSATGIAIVDENAGTLNLNMSSGGYLMVDTNITASGFIKTGGTSSQFLKADGSVDSNSYITSAALNGYATQTWVGQQGYLTSASLNGYATESWVGQQGYLTSSSLNGYATQSWVGQNYLSLTNGGTVNNDITVDGAVNAAAVWIGDGSQGTIILSNNTISFDDGVTISGNTISLYGGTSSQFLKADGSVDSNAYITSAALTGYATQSWVQQQGYLTSSSLSGYATQSWVNTQLGGYLPTSTVLVNTLAKSADGSVKFSGRNFADTYVDFTHDHRWEEIVDRPNIEIGGYGMAYTDGKFGVGIKVPSYPIDVDGSVRATSFVNSSDARLKNIEDYDADISAEAVAMAPAVHYQWKNRKDKTTMVGSIAQYWQNILPEAVSTDDKGFLSMQYDVIALISAISIAKRTVEHEQRIAELESENARLQLELNSIKEVIGNISIN